MARGSQQAQTGATSAQNFSNGLQGNASSLYGELAPELQTEAAHPSGYAPADLARMDTAAQQSAGGSMAGAVGQGSLLAGRTKNAGTADAAIAESAKDTGGALARAALGSQLKNADLKSKQQQEGLSGMEGLYGMDVSGANNALGEVAGNVNANTNAANESWDWAKYILDPAMQAAGEGTGLAMGCWIAEAIYGVNDPRTHTVRAWLNGPFRETTFGNAVMALYLAIGKQVAWVARRSFTLRLLLRPLFDRALARANGQQ
jgi:hypothetical protein